jgi:hypothetical protein
VLPAILDCLDFLCFASGNLSFYVAQASLSILYFSPSSSLICFEPCVVLAVKAFYGDVSPNGNSFVLVYIFMLLGCGLGRF